MNHRHGGHRGNGFSLAGRRRPGKRASAFGGSSFSRTPNVSRSKLILKNLPEGLCSFLRALLGVPPFGRVPSLSDRRLPIGQKIKFPCALRASVVSNKSRGCATSILWSDPVLTVWGGGCSIEFGFGGSKSIASDV